jgi:hypothetical protein
MTEEPEATIRIPATSPVSVNEDGGKLVVTIPPSSPIESTIAVDRVARGLLKGRVIKIQMPTIETDFLVKKLEERADLVWDGLILVNYVMPKESVQQMTHTLDMPGPIHIRPLDYSDDGLTVLAWYKR